jgi:phosphatidyl-myo-inositol dimannoside synthase
MIRWLFPKKKIWLIAHGTDVWLPLGFFKRQLLATADSILSVSEFTKHKMVDVHGVNPTKITLFPNTLDPFWPVPAHFDKPEPGWLARYGLTLPSRVILTVARLRFEEQYKGYDQVLAAMHWLKQRNQLGTMRYLIVGQADRRERERIATLIDHYDLSSYVTLTGYVEDEQLRQIYLLADLFVMPSRGEGFGIVFIEAASHGLPSLAGNADGSPEALLGGQLGHLIDPSNIEQIALALGSSPRDWNRASLSQMAVAHFGYGRYQQRLAELLA